MNTNICVKDDRNFIDCNEAYGILINGGTVMICDCPDYGNEDAICDSVPFIIELRSILTNDQLKTLTNSEVKTAIFQFLNDYQISIVPTNL